MAISAQNTGVSNDLVKPAGLVVSRITSNNSAVRICLDIFIGQLKRRFDC